MPKFEYCGNVKPLLSSQFTWKFQFWSIEANVYMSPHRNIIGILTMTRTDNKQWDLMGSQPVRTFCLISGYCSALNFASIETIFIGFLRRSKTLQCQRAVLKLVVAPSNSRLSNRWCMNTWIQAEKLNNKFFVQLGTAMFGNDNLNIHVAMTHCEGIAEKNRNFFGKVEIFTSLLPYITFTMNSDLLSWG